MAIRADSLNLRTDATAASYAVRDVTRVEVSQGRRSRWLVGAGVGAVGGAGATFLVLNGTLFGGGSASTAPCNRSANQDAISVGECVGLTALGAVAGAGLGALIGGLIRSERWEDRPLTSLRVGAAPSGAVRLGLRLAF
jgi:hypothetical protein